MDTRTGEIKLWNSLTAEEKASGNWIKLPSHDENGELVQCRRRSMLDEMFSRDREREIRQAHDDFAKRGSFDALGRPR